MEFLPECAGTQSTVLEFSAARPSTRFTYFSTEIFGNRYRFRPASSAGDHEAPWSDYRLPRADLVIDVSRGPEGVTLNAAAINEARLPNA